MSGSLVTLLPDSTVIKSGRRITLDERPALKLAERYDLPVPHVYDAYHGPIEGEAAIHTDFIPGEKLDSIWPTMSAEEKASICQQLRDILTTMRTIPWNTGLIGSCSGGEARDIPPYSNYCGGPFPDEKTFNSDFYFDLVGTVPSAIRSALYQQIRSDHRIVFSHGDLATHNILVGNGRITGLLDWENAGWYPEHWDYIKFFERYCKSKDWKECAEGIFPETYEHELAYHQALLRWQCP
jgi:aminoglycoside phosphotransferase (APT) family kinase protein